MIITRTSVAPGYVWGFDLTQRRGAERLMIIGSSNARYNILRPSSYPTTANRWHVAVERIMDGDAEPTYTQITDYAASYDDAAEATVSIVAKMEWSRLFPTAEAVSDHCSNTSAALD